MTSGAIQHKMGGSGQAPHSPFLNLPWANGTGIEPSLPSQGLHGPSPRTDVGVGKLELAEQRLLRLVTLRCRAAVPKVAGTETHTNLRAAKDNPNWCALMPLRAWAATSPEQNMEVDSEQIAGDTTFDA